MLIGGSIFFMFKKGEGGFSGKHHTEESRKKISEHNALKGKHRTEEVKRKISEAQKGKKSIHYKPNALRRNKKYQTFMIMRRRAMKKSNGGSHTFGGWENLKAQYDWTCPNCKRKEPEIKLTEDHIIPLSKGGSDNIENIQPLCKQCNSKKMTKIIKFVV